MKHISLITTTIALLLISTIAFAQRPRVTSGGFDGMQGTQKMNVEYDYTNMEVGHKSERDFIADKKAKYNDKEPGKGDKWEKDWVADRQARFEPRFEDEFNKSGNIQIGRFPNEKYTLIFKTVFTETGYNIGISRKNAYIDGEVWIVETSNKNNIIAKLEVNDCPGRTFMGMDYDTGERIQEAYAMAGKALGKFFRKNVD
jgi:hypothetical protein